MLRTARFASGLLAVLALGCSSVAYDGDSGGEAIGSADERLAAANFDHWTAWTLPVDVCFIRFVNPDNDVNLAGEVPTAAQYADLKVASMEALSETWSRVPGISFVDHDDCTAQMPQHLHIQLHRGSWGGYCGFGVGTTCVVSGDLPNGRDGFKSTMVHEVGHAMGFHHEHKRTDADPESCEADRADACERCKNSIDANASCAAGDWNACAVGTALLPTPVSGPQTFVVDSDEYRHMEGVLVNSATDASLERLTKYDPRSIMNYCSFLNGRDFADIQPTPLDLLGMEMTYPLPDGHPIGCQRACFHTASGVITRTDASLTADWTERGGLNVVMHSQVGSLPATAIGTRSLPEGTSTLTYRFPAPRTGEMLRASGTLVNSNADHTAVTMVVL